MLINMIGTDEEQPVDFDAWKSEPLDGPTSRETLSMAVQAAVASFAVGAPDAAQRERAVSAVSAIAAPPAETTSRVDAA